MNSFHSFKYILLALYKLLANPEDLMHTPKLYNGGFLNKKHKKSLVKQNNDLKKTKQNQPEKIQYLYSKYLYLSNTVALSQI